MPLAARADLLGQAPESRDEEVMADPQQRAGGDVTDARGLDDEDPGPPVGEAAVPVHDLWGGVAFLRGPQGTMAGTQVLEWAVKAPIRTGANRRLMTASSALGHPGSGRE